MASFTITIPDPIVSEVLDFFAHTWGYDNSPGGPHEGITKAAFAKAFIRDYLKLTYQRGHRGLYRDAHVAPADPGIDVT